MEYKDLTYAYIKKGMKLSEHHVQLLSEEFKKRYAENRLNAVLLNDEFLLAYELILLNPEQNQIYTEKKL